MADIKSSVQEQCCVWALFCIRKQYRGQKWEQTVSDGFLKSLTLQQCCRNSDILHALLCRNLLALSPWAALGCRPTSTVLIITSMFLLIPHFHVLTICFFPFLIILYLEELVNSFFCLLSLSRCVFRSGSSPRLFLATDVFLQLLSQVMTELRLWRLGYSSQPPVYKCAPSYKWHTWGPWGSHEQSTFS